MKATPIPSDFITHKDSWRSAIAAMQTHPLEDRVNTEYWQHELKAFDLAYQKLEALKSNIPDDLEMLEFLRSDQALAADVYINDKWAYLDKAELVNAALEYFGTPRIEESPVSEVEPVSEVDLLKSIIVPDLDPSIAHILDNSYNTEYSVWNILCLLSNGYTIWDGRDLRSQIKSLLIECAKRDEERLGYLEAIVSVKRIGEAFGIVHNVSLRNNINGYWEVFVWDYESADILGVFQGNGLRAFKKAITSNTDRFVRSYKAFAIESLTIEEI